VPNQNSRPGGSSAIIRFASITGSVCAIQGARTPTGDRDQEQPAADDRVRAELHVSCT
jgi:hypothetical protein